MMILTEKHDVSINHPFFKELENICFLSKNIYNSTLFSVRQHFFNTNEYLNFYSVNRLFVSTNQQDYRSLPAKVSKHSQMMVDRNFKSFFALLKLKNSGKYDKPISIPKYLKKDGLLVTHYEKGALSFKKQGYIKLSKTNILIKTNLTKEEVSFVRIVPKLSENKMVIEIGYSFEEHEPLVDNNRYCSIDLGLNNLMAISSNVLEPSIIKGTPIKSINQYYNKKYAKIKKELEKTNHKKSSKRLKTLTKKRNNKINDYLHKSSKKLVNHLVTNQINTLIIGYNDGWKQDINIGKVNNQNFVAIPYEKLVSMIEYKCKKEGIVVKRQEESYTSKCSFLDNEEVKKHKEYLGKRVKRGLFKSSEGREINADINGSYNILKKGIKKEVWNSIMENCIEACSKPVKVIKVTY